MIIAILAGMMLLATGSATDGAEATKIVNDLRNLKSASLLYYGDTGKWPATGDLASLDQYTDRPMIAGGRYTAFEVGTEYTVSGIPRYNIGFQLTSANNGGGITKKLAAKATDTGLLKNSGGGEAYDGGTTVYMNMR
jgi:general secretion pathway protein G